MHDMVSLQDIVDEVDVPRESEGTGKVQAKGAVRRIAVAGEFGAGKSSTINAMVGQPCLPCNPGFASRPLIRVGYRFYPLIAGQDGAGRTVQVHDIAELVDRSDLRRCAVQLPLPGLKKTEIVEIPHKPGQGIAEDDFDVMAKADLIIWVTIASQAWRLSEKTVIEALPEEARGRSVLAISRADLLRDDADWEKIEDRLQRDACHYFSEMVFMQASQAHLAACRGNEEAWIETGGPSLMTIAHELCAPRRSRARKTEARP